MNLRRMLLPFVIACMVLGASVGCGGDSSGTKTDCSLSASCTVTFERGVDAKTSILGIDVTLVGVKDDKVTLEVAGQKVTVPAGGQTEAEGFTVSVQKVTKQQVIVKIAASGGGGGEG
jgi:hypothetical protein